MARTRNRRFLGIPDEFWIGFVIMVGCFLKLVYDTRISYSAFTINAGSWMEFADGHPNPGHIGLMQYYMTVMHLPDFDPRTVTCYSNPPFYYILCAAILKIIHQMMGWQIGTCLHCLLCLNAIYVLVGEICGIIMAVGFGIRDRKLVITILILTFFPGFYNLTSTLDGTAFCYMCMMLALNAARSWYVSRRSKTLRTCGIWLGIGMMTSYAAIITLPALIVLFRNGCIDGRRSEVPYRKQFRTFIILAAALGLWWPLYLFFRFGIRPFYVDRTGMTRVHGNLLSRLLLPSMQTLTTHLHTVGDASRESNIWAQTFKTALVDFKALNLRLVVVNGLAVLTLLLSVIICILAHIMWIWSDLSQRVDHVQRNFLLIGYLAMLGGYIYICGRYPYIETMRFSSIMPLFTFPVIGMGLCGEGTPDDNMFEKVTTNIMDALVLIFSILVAFLFGFYAV